MTANLEPARQIITACCTGTLPAEIALMRLILATHTPEDLRNVLDTAASDPDLSKAAELRALAERYPGAWDTVRATAGAVAHDAANAASADLAIARWASQFDAAASISPEASVALYSLGEPEQLALATDEIVGWLATHGLLGPRTTVLDIGCGIGRFEVALHKRVQRIVGTDISTKMLEIARSHCAGMANVEICHSAGRDLAGHGSGCFDVVLAVDSLPYVVAAGDDLIDAHFREFARVLRPDGDLVILNYSYRGDLKSDCADISRHCVPAGFEVIRSGEQPFRQWDGMVFQLRKLTGASSSESLSE
jgi:ubiquinone/menaquinone biosynthesis C-methylase UbiE